MKRLLTWITGIVLIVLGGVLVDYGINRINTLQEPILGGFQLIFGVIMIWFGFEKFYKAIE